MILVGYYTKPDQAAGAFDPGLDVHCLRHIFSATEAHCEAAILAIEAEAAQGAAPRDPVHLHHDDEDERPESDWAAPRAEGLDEWRGFAVLVADTCNDPHLVREAERLLGLSRPSDERVPESEATHGDR